MNDSQDKPKDISINIAPHERLLRISLYEALLKAVNSIADKTVLRILDIGFGRGELLRLLAEKGHKVTGIDPEKECVRLGSQYGTCFQGTFEDVNRLFKPEQFDIIVSSHVL
ncbi:MAG: class I SAM-dependent methyltransferase, partial [Pseudomonadota bacterium]